jgi:hypothetical protein
MKYPLLLVPSLLPFFLAILLSTPPSGPQLPATKAQRDAEISTLRQQLRQTSARISVLEASGHHFLPR